MTLWSIEPHDPLIFGDGKPFSAIPGTRATSLPFPRPSTIAGGVRTHSGRNSVGRFDTTLIPILLQKSIRGPLLVELDENNAVATWLFPAPADSLMLKGNNEKEGKRVWLRPLSMPAGASTNLEHGLQPLAPGRILKEKPHSQPPRFWTWQTYEQWLLAPKDDSALLDLSTLGHNGPVREYRTHVSIKANTQTAREGFLFQTSGLEFMRVDRDEDMPPSLASAKRLALVMDTDAQLREGWDFLGGERRLVNWRKMQGDLPGCSHLVRETIKQDRHCRLLLATPAWFKKGYLPTWMHTCTPSLQVTVLATAVPRYQTVSGWDFEKPRPKPTRRLVPAGSVYFLQLDGADDAIDRFIDIVWMQNISDTARDRLDGFGLSLLGVWDGKLVNLEVQ